MIVVLIPVENVLADGEDLKTAFAHKWAKGLYDSLHTGFRTVALAKADQELARWWLGRNEFHGWSSVLSWSTSVLTYDSWLRDTVRDFLANAWEVAFFVTTDPQVAQDVHDLGVKSLMVGTPFRRPGWKAEDENFVPWEDLKERLA